MGRFESWLRGLTRRRGTELSQTPLARLKAGFHGVAVSMPEDSAFVEDFGDSGFLVQVPSARLLWGIVYEAFPLSLHSDEHEMLYEDLRRSTRVAFAAELRQAEAADSGDARRRCMPVTAEAGWTPLIEAKVVELDGGPALWIVHRLAFEYGRETVAARLLVPTADGVVEFFCKLTDTTTGVRKALILGTFDDARKPPSSATAVELQAFVDDPRHDGVVPDALARVRGGLHWLVSPCGGGVRVTEPPRIERSRVLVLEHEGCSIVPPQRFHRFRPHAPLADSLVPFARVGCSVVAVAPWSMDVWKLSGVPDVTDIEGLRVVAEGITRDWTREGDIVIEAIESNARPSRTDCIELRSSVRFLLNGRQMRSIQHWIAGTADYNGCVWRLSITVDAELEAAGFDAEMDQLAASWRPI